VLALAAVRAELPWTTGDLHQRKADPRYILEFRLPAEPKTSA
jgi:hypothetical protein